eukprot:c45653_g1_i1 orf=83-247(+)
MPAYDSHIKRNMLLLAVCCKAPSNAEQVRTPCAFKYLHWMISFKRIMMICPCLA